MKQRRPPRRKQFRQRQKRYPSQTVDLSESLKQELATLEDRLARVERGEAWGQQSSRPYTPAEKAAEIAHTKARIAEIKASLEDQPHLGARQALDQTADLVRAAHEKRAREAFDVSISSGSMSGNPPLPLFSGAGGFTADASQVKAVEQADQAKLEAVAVSVRTNRTGIVLSVASLIVLIDDKLATLRDERPNARDAQAVRDESIARYESVRRELENLGNAAVGLDGQGASKENAENAAMSFGRCVRDWWDKRHKEICSKAFDAGLFVSCVAICSLAGSGGELAVAVSGALIGGKPVIEALKAIAKPRRSRRR